MLQKENNVKLSR